LEETESTIRSRFANHAANSEALLIENAGEPVAVVLTPAHFRALTHDRCWATVDRIRERNADLDPDEVVADVTEMVKEARRERRAG
jgi:hypothetical protein